MPQPHSLRSSWHPPTLVAGGLDPTPPRLGRAVTDRIANAGFVVLPNEAHQPLQERPDECSALARGFWTQVDGR